MQTGPRVREYDCDPATVRAWARAAGDHNPLHLDPEFAATTPFGVPIVHGHLLMAIVVNEVEELLGARLTDGGSVSIRFRAPVPVGSALSLTTSEPGELPAWVRAEVESEAVLAIEVEGAS